MELVFIKKAYEASVHVPLNLVGNYKYLIILCSINSLVWIKTLTRYAYQLYNSLYFRIKIALIPKSYFIWGIHVVFTMPRLNYIIHYYSLFISASLCWKLWRIQSMYELGAIHIKDVYDNAIFNKNWKNFQATLILRWFYKKKIENKCNKSQLYIMKKWVI